MLKVDSLQGARDLGCDTLIDVRSPGEFAHDHVPGAINLPVLSDAERAEIGTLYVQQSKFEARRLGAAAIARNVAGHLEGALAARPGSWRPLLYCWRGGQRSRAMALILSEVGWRTTLLVGGYRTYRRGVVADLYAEGAPLDIVLLDGPTGVGKTAVLGRLALLGVQTLDLEALANHRGSLFGGLGEQPSQKLFESRLAAALAAFDPAQPIVVEAESSRIGEVFLPPRLWRAMGRARRVAMHAGVGARAEALLRDYREATLAPDAVQTLIARLPVRHGEKRLAGWSRLADEGQWVELVTDLVERHYDPSYRGGGGDAPLLSLTLDKVDGPGLDRAAQAIASALSPAA